MQINGSLDAFYHQGSLVGDPYTAKLTTSDPDGENGKIIIIIATVIIILGIFSCHLTTQ